MAQGPLPIAGSAGAAAEGSASPLSPPSSPLAGPGGKRDNVAKELLDSEKTFVLQMSTLVSVYIKPLRWWAAELQANYGKSLTPRNTAISHLRYQFQGSMHPVLPQMFLNEIFANVEQLLVFNQHIVEQFTEIYKTTKAFGGFFKKAAPFFKMYSSYVSNYDRAMETLMNLIETRLDFASFVRACELQEGCKGLNLRSYLIMPVQRIPRYKLLLTELLKYTPEDHSDYQDLVAAVALVSGVVNSINEDIKRQEKRFKVMEVQERFETVLVSASRTYVREGELIKMCRKGPKRFIFVLFNDLLIYGSEKIASSERCSLHRKLDLGELFIVDSGENERSFIVATKVKSFVVQCKDLVEKADWMSAFAACFSEMEKTVVYGRASRNSLSKEGRLTSVPLWMVREGQMARETYLMPDLEERAYGFLEFNQLRLIVDPQAQDKGGMGQQVLNILRRGSLAPFNIKVGPDSPVPCEQVSSMNIVAAIDMSEDGSTYTLSPSSDSDSPRPTTNSNRLSVNMADASVNQADLLGLADGGSYPSPNRRRTRDGGDERGEGGGNNRSGGGISSNPQAPQQAQQQQLHQGTSFSPSKSLRSQQQHLSPQQPQQRPVSAKGPPKPALPHQQQAQQQLQLQLQQQQQGIQLWPPYQHPQSIHDLQEKQQSIFDREDNSSHRSPQRQSIPPHGSSSGVADQQQQRYKSPPQKQVPPSVANPYMMGPDFIRELSSPSTSSTTASQGLSSTTSSLEYVAVIPVTEMGLGLFLKDESGRVIIGGFRSPRTGLGINPSQRAGVKLGDILIRVNGVPVSTVAQTIAALRESRMEQVIALTLRKSDANAASTTSSFGSTGGGVAAAMRKSQRSPTKTFGNPPSHTILS